MSKLQEKCSVSRAVRPLHQISHNFVKNCSVVTNMLSLLKEIYVKIVKHAENRVIAFYTDFSKAVDKVPHYGKCATLELEAVS